MAVGDVVRAGQVVAVVESMKMHHDVAAETAGTVTSIAVAVEDQVAPGAPVVVLRPGGGAADDAVADEAIDLDAPRADLAEVLARHAVGLDAARPEAVAKRHGRGPAHGAGEHRRPGRRRARFVEYGAAGHRRPAPAPIARGADRAHAGRRPRRRASATVDGGPGRSSPSYDYTVLAGTQGHQNHRKKDRLFELAERQRLPVVFFAEGGGGRPGDTDVTQVSRARLPGVPPVRPAVGAGAAGRHRARAAASPATPRCSAAATWSSPPRGQHRHGRPGDDRGRWARRRTPRGRSGPIERAGGQRCRSTSRGRREPTRSAVAKRYLVVLPGPVGDVERGRPAACCAHVVPEDRLQVYDVRGVLDAAGRRRAPCWSCGAGFGPGMITALARVEGRPLGRRGQQPGAPRRRDRQPTAPTRRPGSCSCATPSTCRCSSLCDTPGFMVGPGRRRRPPPSATSAGCSSPAPT